MGVGVSSPNVPITDSDFVLKYFQILVGRTADMGIFNFGQKINFDFGVMQKNPQFLF